MMPEKQHDRSNCSLEEKLKYRYSNWCFRLHVWINVDVKIKFAHVRLFPQRSRLLQIIKQNISVFVHINSLNWSSLGSMRPACGAWGWRAKGRIPVVKTHRRKIRQRVRGSYSHKRTSLSLEGHHGCMQPGARWLASLHSLLALCQAEHTSWLMAAGWNTAGCSWCCDGITWKLQIWGALLLWLICFPPLQTQHRTNSVLSLSLSVNMEKVAFG